MFSLFLNKGYLVHVVVNLISEL